MTKEEEPVEEVWSCSALSSWVPANLGSSHKLDDHAETTRVTSGGRKAQDPGNTRDTGKTNRKANFSVALEHADTFFWDEEGPETSGLKLLRKQDLQPGCFSYTDWDKSGGWPCFCERWHIPPDCSGHFQQLSLALPSPSPPTDPQTNHMPFKNIFQNSTSCSPSHSWVGPTADLPRLSLSPLKSPSKLNRVRDEARDRQWSKKQNVFSVCPVAWQWDTQFWVRILWRDHWKVKR